MKQRFFHTRQQGLSLVELLIAMALSATVMSGVVSVLLVSKNNFTTERELASLQENARFVVRLLSDEIRMAGFTGCSRKPLFFANSVKGSNGNWLLDGTGLQGFEHEAGTSSFPADFSADVLSNTDAVVVRRGEERGLSVTFHNFNSAILHLNKQHDIKPGQIMVVSTPDCEQAGIFQMSGPTNNGGNATTVVHNTGGSTSPGNCTKLLKGNFICPPTGSPSGTKSESYDDGSRVFKLSSKAFYIGTSATGGGVPALFMRSLDDNSVTSTAQELVQGVENMQILYGVDTSGNDGIADIYLKANAGAMNWDQVVSARLFLRMRSINPVYNRDEPYGVFQGIADTDGSDRFMRQLVTTTIQIRN